MSNKKISGKCVKDLNPSETSPAEVIASPVQGDVQRVEISSFPVEKLEEIKVNEKGIDHRTKFKTIELDGCNCKIESKKGPAHHSRPAVGPLFDVNTKQARMKLNTSIELIRKGGISSSFCYLRKVVTFKKKPSAQDKRKYVEGGDDLVKLMPDGDRQAGYGED